MRILITGANGVLAHSVINMFTNTKHKLFFTMRGGFKDKLNNYLLGDLSEYAFVKKLIKKTNPNIIIHLAANTDVDFCEKERLQSLNDNFLSTKNIVDLIKERGIHLIYVSTASIFEGKKKSGYLVNDKPNPVNFYALTKFFSEEYIQKNLINYSIIRLGWLLGNPLFKKKFFGKVINRLQKKDNIFYLANNLWGSLSFSDNVSDLIVHLAEHSIFGVFHCVADGYASRLDIFNEILAFYKMQKRVKYFEVSNDYFDLPAKRPKYEILINLSLKKMEIITLDDWKLHLYKHLEKYGRINK